MDGQPFGPELDLHGRLLPGIVKDFPAFFRQDGRHFQEQGRFADARFTADQGHRMADDAPAQHAVEFVHARQQPFDLLRVDGADFLGLVAGIRFRAFILCRGGAFHHRIPGLALRAAPVVFRALETAFDAFKKA
jgi:hypothetical protein